MRMRRGSRAMTHGLTIATRNVGEFANLEIDVINPWETMAGQERESR